ncbi:MAG TPA: hypothetical protein VK674_04635 [Candidatus Limnocylindria bacterium]|nr:hypothetical protein [Candidatus Limnocylindria bacterium]
MAINSLQKYGFDPSLAERARLHRERNILYADEFYERAGNDLAIYRQIVVGEVIPHLEEYEGNWHPSGFMIFHLGMHPELGSIRLHIWPKGLRMREDRGAGKLGDVYDGDIHDHGWFVIAEALAEYKDTIYKVGFGPRSFTEEELVTSGLFAVHSVSYFENGLVGLTELPFVGRVRAAPSEQRTIQPTDLHLLTPGQFHAPTIPDDELAATLAINSHREIPGPHVLLQGRMQTLLRPRPSVTTEHKLLAKAQLLEALAAEQVLWTPPASNAG